MTSRRRIWHAEVPGLVAALERLGRRDLAADIRALHVAADSRTPARATFIYEPTGDGELAVTAALDQVRASRSRA